MSRFFRYFVYFILADLFLILIVLYQQIQQSYTDAKDKTDDIKKRLPTAIIIGTPKSGTDALRKFLSLNPLLVVAKDETNFFSYNYRRGLEWYRSQMPLSVPNQTTLEKSMYFRYKVVPERIYAYNKTVKLLLMVQDPVKNIVSLIAHHRETGYLKPNDTYQKILINQRNGSLSFNHPSTRDCFFYEDLKLWLKYFPMVQFLILDGESFRKNPLPWIKDAERFLGLPSYVTQKDVFYDKNRGFHCWVENGKKACFDKSKGRRHPPVPDWILEKLYKHFAPLNAQFFSLIGQRFDWKPLTQAKMEESDTFAIKDRPLLQHQERTLKNTYRN